MPPPPSPGALPPREIVYWSLCPSGAHASSTIAFLDFAQHGGLRHVLNTIVGAVRVRTQLDAHESVRIVKLLYRVERAVRRSNELLVQNRRLPVVNLSSLRYLIHRLRPAAHQHVHEAPTKDSWRRPFRPSAKPNDAIIPTTDELFDPSLQALRQMRDADQQALHWKLDDDLHDLRSVIVLTPPPEAVVEDAHHYHPERCSINELPRPRSVTTGCCALHLTQLLDNVCTQQHDEVHDLYLTVCVLTQLGQIVLEGGGSLPGLDLDYLNRLELAAVATAHRGQQRHAAAHYDTPYYRALALALVPLFRCLLVQARIVSLRQGWWAELPFHARHQLDPGVTLYDLSPPAQAAWFGVLCERCDATTSPPVLPGDGGDSRDDAVLCLVETYVACLNAWCEGAGPDVAGCCAPCVPRRWPGPLLRPSFQNFGCCTPSVVQSLVDALVVVGRQRSMLLPVWSDRRWSLLHLQQGKATVLYGPSSPSVEVHRLLDRLGFQVVVAAQQPCPTTNTNDMMFDALHCLRVAETVMRRRHVNDKRALDRALYRRLKPFLRDCIDAAHPARRNDLWDRLLAHPPFPLTDDEGHQPSR